MDLMEVVVASGTPWVEKVARTRSQKRHTRPTSEEKWLLWTISLGSGQKMSRQEKVNRVHRLISTFSSKSVVIVSGGERVWCKQTCEGVIRRRA
jgi:protein involved in ribonucleotide reduction